MSSRTTIWDERTTDGFWFATGVLLRPLQLALALASALYLATLTAILFRPVEVNFYYADRVAFCVLVFCVALRVLAMREPVPWIAGISWPMLGLIGLAVLRALLEPFDVLIWSLVANKFIVPFVLFHLALLVFRRAAARTHFEIFVIVVLGYLVFVAIAFLLDARALIFPRYILDEGLGVHVHRARGPFLQAVANGVSLNMLGLLALISWEKRRKLILLLWIVLPVAVLATMTRAVWMSFAASTVLVAFRFGRRQLRRVCIGVAAVGLLLGLGIGLGSSSLQSSLRDRTEERAPVEVRLAVYEAGWAMFQERPLTGWTAGGMYAELARRMQGYRLRSFYIHNTYLSLLIEFGIPGLLLYAILFFNLFRLARAGPGKGAECGSLASLRRIWPILLGVYLFNAVFVDMVYQFVNGLLFTAASLLCASSEVGS